MFFTHGRWTVHEDQVAAFLTAWEQFAEWASRNVPGEPWAILLRDRDKPRQFFSFGPWDSLEAIADFRSRPESTEFLGRVRPMLEDVEVFTLDVAAILLVPSRDSQSAVQRTGDRCHLLHLY
jgi:quinol monooxygenase YgiN